MGAQQNRYPNLLNCELVLTKGSVYVTIKSEYSQHTRKTRRHPMCNNKQRAGLTKTVFVCFVISLATTASAVERWNSVAQAPKANLRSVFFIDDKIGWLAGDDGLIAKTSDGGTTWETMTIPTTVNLHSICFSDLNHGWAVGDEGTILHTRNGGRSWTPQESGKNYSLYAVDFIRPNEGWVCGNLGLVLHTTDGGETWENQSVSRPGILDDVDFLNEKMGWVAGSGGTMFHTRDGGKNWKTQKAGTDERLYGVYFFDEKRGWAVGSNGEIRATTDGGTTWEAQESSISETLYDVHFATPAEGWVVGDNGLILHTTTEGIQWDAARVETSETLLAIHYAKPAAHKQSPLYQLTLWSVGENGAMFKTHFEHGVFSIIHPIPPEQLPKEPSVPVGSLYIRSDPDGAIIDLDGELFQKPTPAHISNLPLGKYTLKLTKKGHGTVVKTVRVKENQKSGEPGTEILVKLSSRRRLVVSAIGTVIAVAAGAILGTQLQ
jgi:photosystem II stability/assembly factor-like uncharacterized protein